MTIATTMRAAPRIGRVLRVLARHGFVRAVRGRSHWPAPAAAREALEELGVVYVKFGQVLAVRRDVLPPEYIVELEHLQDRMPPAAFSHVQARIEKDFGQALGALFKTFDEVPIAAASIAQVHSATLQDGRRVVVKVLRPGLDAQIADDIAVLAHLAALAEQVAPRLRGLDLTGMVREFRDSLGRETNLSLEGRTIRRFRASLENDRDVWIPDMVPERTSAGVLTVEHSPGQRIDIYGRGHAELGPRLARGVAALVLRQVFETGLFNADPHPGNLFVLPDGRLCLHDFGMIGELDARLREGLIHVLEATVDGDARAMTDAYLELGAVGEDVDRAALETDLDALLRRIRERPLTEVSVGDALGAMLRVGSEHRVRNPGAVLLLARAFLIAESVMRGLDPHVSVMELFGAEVRRVELDRLSPARVLRQSRDLAKEVERALREGPSDLRRALRRLGDGELGRIHAPGLEAVALRSSRDVERLTGAVVSSALLVAGALLVTVSGWHRTAGDLLLVGGLGGATITAFGALTASRRRRVK